MSDRYQDGDPELKREIEEEFDQNWRDSYITPDVGLEIVRPEIESEVERQRRERDEAAIRQSILDILNEDSPAAPSIPAPKKPVMH